MASNGYAPFDDDLAESLYSEIWQACNLPRLIRQMLSGVGDDEISVIEVRALAYLLIVLGKSNIWPIDDLDDDLELVIGKLDQCIKLNEVPDLQLLMKKEKAVLQNQLSGLDAQLIPMLQELIQLWYQNEPPAAEATLTLPPELEPLKR